MRAVLVVLTLLSLPASAFQREPDEIFLRHARALIPQFLEEQSRAYGTPLGIDLDSLRVERDLFAPPMLAGLAPVEYATAVFLMPLHLTDHCRRVDGVIPERNARASFFVRMRPSHFELTRSCLADENRPPLLIVNPAGQAFHRFSDEEIVRHVKPLVTALVQKQAAGAAVDPESFRLKAPWFDPRVEFTDQRGLLEGRSARDCRNVQFDMPVTHQRGSVAVSITYDTNDILPKVPLEYQTLHSDARVLRQFRFALVRGCTFWNRDVAPVMGFRRL